MNGLKLTELMFVYTGRFDPIRPGLTKVTTEPPEPPMSDEEIEERVLVAYTNTRRELVAGNLRHEKRILGFRAAAAISFAIMATWVMPSFLGVTVVWTIMAMRTAHKVRQLRAELRELEAPRAHLLR